MLLTKFIRGKLSPAGTTAIGIRRPLNRDPTQPGQHMFLRLHAVEVAIQRKENILRHFFRRAAIPQDAKRDAVDAGLVSLHNVTKSISRRRDRCHR